MGLEQLFWSQHYKTDASLLAQSMSSEARGHLKYAEEVKAAIDGGVKILSNTICDNCMRELHCKGTQSQVPITGRHNSKRMKRLPEEQQRFIKDFEVFLIQRETPKEGSAVDEQYVTADEWYETEISCLNIIHDNKIKELQRERDALKIELDDLRNSYNILKDNHQTEVDTLQKTIKGNQIRIAAQSETIANHEKGLNENKATIERLEQFVKTKDNTIVELTGTKEEKSKSTQTELIHATKQSTKSTQITPKQETKLPFSLSFGGGARKEDLQKTQEELRQAKTQLMEKTDELANAWEQLQCEKIKNESLEKSLRQQKEELTTVRRLKENVSSDIETLIQKKTQDDNTLQEKEHQLSDAHSQIETLHTEKEALITDMCNKELEMSTLQRHLEEKNEKQGLGKKTIVLGLHNDRSGLGKSLVDMVVKELTKGVQDRLDRNNLNITIRFSQTPSEVNGWLKVVLCLNMSRVGTNITDVLKGMKGDRDVFVLVLHHTNKSNLSSLTPTSHRITGSDLRQLGGILDMAFGSESGLYECDLNNSAVDRIASVLKKYSLL